MKKWMIFVLAGFLAISMAGCGSTQATETEAALQLEGEGDVQTCLDLATSPLDGGLLITVDKGEKTVNMQVTNEEGEATMEFYKFSPEDKTCQRYRHVAMMGTGFYYVFDYENGALLQIINLDEEDVTQSSKDNNRFEGAETETKEQVDLLLAYFEEAFEMTVEESIQ